MTGYLPNIVQRVTLPPRSDGDPTVRREFNWGYTIYRTAYGGDTEASWNTLLKNIRGSVHHRTDHGTLREYGYDPVNISDRDLDRVKKRQVWEAAPKARELFRLDPRSDQALLENASPDRLRELFKEGAPGPDGKPPVMHEMGTFDFQGVKREALNTPGWEDDLGPFADRMFLVADAEVLDAVAAAPADASEDDLWFRHLWVKLYSVDVMDMIDEEERRDEAICGWAKVAVDILIDIWGRVTERSLDEILPRSSEEGRDLAVWNLV